MIMTVILHKELEECVGKSHYKKQKQAKPSAVQSTRPFIS